MPLRIREVFPSWEDQRKGGYRKKITAEKRLRRGGTGREASRHKINAGKHLPPKRKRDEGGGT